MRMEKRTCPGGCVFADEAEAAAVLTGAAAVAQDLEAFDLCGELGFDNLRGGDLAVAQVEGGGGGAVAGLVGRHQRGEHVCVRRGAMVGTWHVSVAEPLASSVNPAPWYGCCTVAAYKGATLLPKP